jgi:hypothetical protein
MAIKELKPYNLENRLGAYANWVGELRRGKIPAQLPEDTTEPLAKLSEELRLLAEVIVRREDQLNKLFEVVHTVERGILVEDVLDSIFKSFAAIIPYDRIGCAFLSGGGTRLTAYWARSNLGPPQITKGYSQLMEGSSLQDVFRTGEPRILNDLKSYLAASRNRTPPAASSPRAADRASPFLYLSTAARSASFFSQAAKNGHTERSTRHSSARSPKRLPP